MTPRRRYLDVRPRRAPKWWPRTGRTVEFVGVLRDGVGWVHGNGDLMTVHQRALAKRLLNCENPIFRTRAP